MNVDVITHNPDEHARFAAYLEKLRQVTDAGEVDLVRRVLTDPDPTMAQSAVLRHLDRRAAALHLEPAYQEWAQAMDRATTGSPFLAQRLREWALLRAITLELPWQAGDLLAASHRLQLMAATGTNTQAVEILAEAGSTRRIRNTARATLRGHRAES
ncbi:hypothetical protein ACFCWY_01195 [Streptomyces sp. NPDC056362]|uniref:hypothetical protein n=1 Tax=unclassified Streptomyces TaxID=2593676 RepID=UPI0035DE577F